MQSEIGRFLDGRRLETQQMIRVVYDACMGQGADVTAWIEGKELAFGNKGEDSGPGFVRIMPLEFSLILAFPRGHEIPDPQKRTTGVINSRTSMTIDLPSDVDVYVRRMIDAAYALES